MVGITVDSASGWAEACSSAFVPLRVKSAAPRFTASLRQREFGGGITLTSVMSDSSEVYRSSRVIAANPRDDLIISLHRSGLGAVTQHGRRAALRPGQAAMYVASAPYDLSFPSRMSELVLQLPRRRLVVPGRRIGDLTARTLPDGAPLRALGTLAGALESAAPLTDGVETEAVADSFAMLLTATLAAEAHDPLPLDSSVLRLTLRRYVEEHFRDPLLTPDHLARVHHISLRQLQKLFALDDDSPAAFIRRRRLQHAHALLLENESVSSASLRAGFLEPGTFARAFKREYGVVPSALTAT